jgi:phytoene desaturase
MLTLREAAAGAPGKAPQGGPAVGAGPRGRPRAVVIGAGFGGLAAAARLGARGFDVTLCERLDRPGGRGRQFAVDGYTFDAGPTIITAPFLFEDLWKTCGRRLADDVTLVKLDPFYRIVYDDGAHFDAAGTPEAMRAEVARLAPADLPGYLRFERDSAAIYDYAFQGLAYRPFNRVWHLAEMAPNLLRLGGWKSPYSYVSWRVKSEKLRFALSFHPVFIGGDPFATSSFYCLINRLEQGWGVNYAVGGTGALVRGMEGLVASVGGKLRYGAEVAEIETREGRASGVRLSSGERLPAEIVVANADPATVYRKMMPTVKRRRWTDRKLDRMHYSMSVFVWYFGTDRQWPGVQHHSIVLGPRYRGLIRDIFRAKKLTEDFSLYLYRPTASDPSMAPPGHDSFYALVPVPHLDSGDDWQALAEPYRARLQKRLEETLLPGLGRHVTASRVITPLHFRDELLSEKGAAFSFEPRLLQSGWFRPHNDSEELKGLYFVGAGTHPGAGLPGAVGSAAIVDGMIPAAASLV